MAVNNEISQPGCAEIQPAQSSETVTDRNSRNNRERHAGEVQTGDIGNRLDRIDGLQAGALPDRAIAVLAPQDRKVVFVHVVIAQAAVAAVDRAISFAQTALDETGLDRRGMDNQAAPVTFARIRA